MKSIYITNSELLTFQNFDKDKDGFLTLAELRKIMTARGEDAKAGV